MIEVETRATLLRQFQDLADLVWMLDEHVDDGYGLVDWARGRYFRPLTDHLELTCNAGREIWAALNRVHDGPVSTGTLAGRSFAEIVVRAAEARYRILCLLSDAPSRALRYDPDGPCSGVTWPSPQVRVHALDLDALAIASVEKAVPIREHWSKLPRFTSLEAVSLSLENEFERAELIHQSDNGPVNEVKTTQGTQSGVKLAAKSDRKSDRKTDTLRPWTPAAQACAEAFIAAYTKFLNDEGKKPSKKLIIAAYLKTKPGSAATISKAMQDHPEKWKPGTYRYPRPAKNGQRIGQR